MSIFQYPDLGYFTMLTTANVELGIYKFVQAGDLSIANLRVYHRNPNPFSYQLRLVLSQRKKGPALIASNWEEFSNETIGQNAAHWLGDLTFTFPDYSLRINDDYYIRLESTGYTRSGNTTYLGVWANWGFGKSWIPSVGSADSGGARIALGVKQ